MYTTKAVVNSMASGLGPLMSVVLFALLGNRWEVRPILQTLNPKKYSLLDVIMPVSVGRLAVNCNWSALQLLC